MSAPRGRVGHDRAVRFRSGLVVGFAVGYYLGAKAGRERYDEIESWLEKLRRTDAYRRARAQVTQVWTDRAGDARSMLDDLTRPTDPRQPTDPVDLGRWHDIEPTA
jgi:hypothetical protein